MCRGSDRSSTSLSSPSDSTAPAAGREANTAPRHSDLAMRLVDPYSQRCFILQPHTEVILGREDAAWSPDIDLSSLVRGIEAMVSRRHAHLAVYSGLVVLKDLGSTNGTWVNGQRLQPEMPVALQDGDVIECGQVKVIFRTS